MPRLVESLQYWQVPVHARSQQTPSTQWPELHSAIVVQFVPLLLRPHDPDTHEFDPEHCALPVQLAQHEVAF